MTDNFLFRFSALSVMPFWLLMIFLPSWKYTKLIISSPYIILPPLFCYLILLVRNFDKSIIKIFTHSSPQRLAELLKNPWASTLVWSYAGAFDLFIGRWMFVDAQSNGIPHWPIILPLVIAIFSGPAGLALYFLVNLFF